MSTSSMTERVERTETRTPTTSLHQQLPQAVSSSEERNVAVVASGVYLLTQST